MLSRIEKQLKRRFAIGSQVSEHSIVQDFMRQVGQGALQGWAVKPGTPGCCWGHETPSSGADCRAFWPCFSYWREWCAM